MADRTPTPTRRPATRRSYDRGCSFRKPLEERPEPLEELAEDPGCRSPDEVAVDRVGVGLDRYPAADQAALLEAGQQIGKGQLDDGVDLVGIGAERPAGLNQTNERVDRVVGDDRRNR